ncbi:hypothetical protein EGJ57_23640 [Brucella anthropi]|nr:hypothetical protein EGJ57_23640 [Brucella anthropi]
MRRHYKNAPNDILLDTLLSKLRRWLDQFGAPPTPLPTAKAPGDYTWYDMSVAWRTMVIIGALSLVGRDEELFRHLATHAAALFSDDFYAGIGNHALHQDEALLSAALVLDRRDYFKTALQRLQALREKSVDDEGVSLEGAPAYHLFNLFWWRNTDRRLAIVNELVEETGIPEIPNMRPFLRYAIAPDGKLVPLGDTTLSNNPLVNIAADKYPQEFIQYLKMDPQLNFVMSRGLDGERLTETMKVFGDGYWFSRSNTPDRKSEEHSHASMRFGAGLATRVHAHDDAGSITFYPRGIRVIEDGGLFGYYGGEAREFVKSNLAHNVVVVPDRKYYRSAVSNLEHAASTADFDQATVSVTAIEKTKWSRIVAHAPDHDFIFVQDHVATGGAALYQQFNLGDSFDVVELRQGRVDASNGKENISLIWFDPQQQLSLTKGRLSPRHGWRSTFEGEIHPVSCICAKYDKPEVDQVIKLAVVVLLLQPGEQFSQIAIHNVSFATKHTNFVIRRACIDIACRINLVGESKISVVAK